MEEILGFAEQNFGTAWLAEELERTLRSCGVLLDLYDVGVVGREHEQFAVGKLVVNLFSELQAALLRHGDVAEEESGVEGSNASQTFGGRVDRLGLVAVRLKDHVESIGYQTVVVDNQNTLLHMTPRAQKP
jgi:hypothetical protein